MLDYATIVSDLAIYSELFSLPVMLIYSIVGIVMAFFGYKIFIKFRSCIYAIGAGIIAYTVLTYFPVEGYFPDVYGLSFTAAIVIAAALLAAILAKFIYKFVAGALVGYSLGTNLVYVFLGENEIVEYIVGGVLALVFGILFVKIFKAVTILETSLTGSLLTGSAFGIMLFPETFSYHFAQYITTYYTGLGATATDVEKALETVGLTNIPTPSDISTTLFRGIVLLSCVVGIVAVIVQFKKNREN